MSKNGSGSHERRAPKSGRRGTDGQPKNGSGSVANLGTEIDVRADEISVDGKPVCVPTAFGSDGKDHYLGHMRRSPFGKVTAFCH